MIQLGHPLAVVSMTNEMELTDILENWFPYERVKHFLKVWVVSQYSAFGYESLCVISFDCFFQFGDEIKLISMGTCWEQNQCGNSITVHGWSWVDLVGNNLRSDLICKGW